MEVKIGNKTLNEKDSCLIALEPSATYNNVNEAKNMIKASAMAGADCIKFQTFLIGDADRIMGNKDIKIKFTTNSGKKEELVYDALKRRELSETEWKELIEYSNEQNILFITAPYFPETVEFLSKCKVDALKVSKGDINNVLLIDAMAKTNKPIILDSREKFSDVQKAIKICEENNNYQIIIMHCPSGYPAENSGVHLRAITEIKKQYDYPVGFADHSPGDLMNYGAIAMGVKMIEKTITLDKNTENVEHFMSLELNELKDFINNVHSLEDAMGDPNIILTSRVEENARRSLVAKRDIFKDEKISLDMLDFKRPGNSGISCSEGFLILGGKALEHIEKGTFIQKNMIE